MAFAMKNEFAHRTNSSNSNSGPIHLIPILVSPLLVEVSPLMVEVNPIMVEVNLGGDLSTLIATIMDIPWRHAIRYMDTHLVSNKGIKFLQAIPML